MKLPKLARFGWPKHADPEAYTSEADDTGTTAILGSEKRCSNNIDTQRASSSQQYTTIEKLGVLAWIIVIIGMVLIVASLSFLAFLWAADSTNLTWHKIVMNGWMTRAVSLTSLVLRNSMVLQAGALSSMLAALALEKTQVIFDQLASLSTMRNAASGPYWLCWLLLKSAFRSPRIGSSLSVFSAVFTLVVISVLGQFISTLLLSDLQPPASLPGFTKTIAQNTGFQYVARNGSWQDIPTSSKVSAWTRKAPFYPTFAEYSGKIAGSLPPYVVDTGTVLRAFLPISDEKERSVIKSYVGQATVVDTRVICQAPHLNSTSLFRNFGQMALTTTIRPRWTNEDLVDLDKDELLTRSGWEWADLNACYMALPGAIPSSQWPLSLCQVDYAGGLFSAFSAQRTYQVANNGPADLDEMNSPVGIDQVPSTPPGAQYLALNITKGQSYDWETIIGELNVTSPKADLRAGEGLTPYSMVSRGEWLDLTFDPTGKLQISVSLCHAAFDSADLSIDVESPEDRVSSTSNRTEPSRSFDPSRITYNYDEVLRQYGQTRDGSFVGGMHSERGVLSLGQRQSWIPNNTTDSPRNQSFPSFLLNAARMENPRNNLLPMGPTANFSLLLSDASVSVAEKADWSPVFAETSLVGLVQAVLQNDGDVAHALQSAITVLSSMTYYDQLDRFNHQDSIQLLNFEQSLLFPQHTRGLGVVAAVVIAHMLMVIFITIIFIRGTRVSSLGNAWQAVAQVVDPRTNALLARVQMKTDSLVQRAMQDGLDGGTSHYDEFVALEPASEEGRTVMVSRGSARSRTLYPQRWRRGALEDA